MNQCPILRCGQTKTLHELAITFIKMYKYTGNAPRDCLLDLSYHHWFHLRYYSTKLLNIQLLECRQYSITIVGLSMIFGAISGVRAAQLQTIACLPFIEK